MTNSSAASETLNVASKALLDPGNLTQEDVQKILKQTLTPGVEFADIYFQFSQHESWFLEEGIIKKGGFSIDQGFGLRAISGDKTGFAYADALDLQAMREASCVVRNIVNAGKNKRMRVWHNVVAPRLYSTDNPLYTLTDDDKIEWLKKIDAQTRAQDSRVKQVFVNLSGSHKIILLFASDGTMAADIRPLVRLDVSVLVEENGKREYGSSGGGARTGYQFFFDANLNSRNKKCERASQYAKEAVRIALVNLSADSAPSGSMPVVLGQGWPGVLLHEAVGHGLEGDFNRKNTSVYAGKIGKKVASPLCTVIDQGNMPGERRGSLNIDDEGTLTQRTVLIENGILRGYMLDKLNAKLMKTKSTGNGRRASYAHIPLPRMTNTYLLAGNHDPQEIISSVDKGIYAVNFHGGQVNVISGEFVFTTSEAYLIEKGKVTKPIKGATLIGNGPDALCKVTMVGNDLALDPGVGTCGKDGQEVAVGIGQPTLKVSELTVGGTA